MKQMGVPLAQLEAIGLNHERLEAIGYWHYWMARGEQPG